MKTEISHPENIPPPPRYLLNPLNKPNTTEIIPTPPKKIPNTCESISTPPKRFKPLLEKSQLPCRKLPLPKNSITITDIISNTRTKSQPFPEKSQPLLYIYLGRFIRKSAKNN